MIISTFLVILVHLLSTIVYSTCPPDASLKGPGISGCDCWGLLQVNCHTPEVPINKFPKECTSFIYGGICVDLNNKIIDIVVDTSGKTGYLDNLIATNKKVMMYFSKTNEMEWITALNVSADSIGTVAQNDMQSIQVYLNQHKGIAGIIFILLDRHELYELTGNLKTYIDVMRSTFPDLEIGMSIDSIVPLFYHSNPESKWLDFSILEPSFDFYILNMKQFYMYNCTDQFIHTGVFPLTGNYDYSIDTLRIYLESVGIPKSKLYYNYQAYGTQKVKSDVDVDCTTFYPNICSAKTGVDDNELCSDTLQTFFEKGRYANANGVGFITGNIDIDDADGSCQCGRSFPAFYALLDGFTGASPPPVCPLFDRC